MRAIIIAIALLLLFCGCASVNEQSSAGDNSPSAPATVKENSNSKGDYLDVLSDNFVSYDANDFN